MTDNTTALAYVRNKGGVKSQECNEVALEIWQWAEERDMVLTIAHIPGVENVLADKKSRVFADNLEWELNGEIFEKETRIFGIPEIDLFATRLNSLCLVGQKHLKHLQWMRSQSCSLIYFSMLFPHAAAWVRPFRKRWRNKRGAYWWFPGGRPCRGGGG